MDFATFAWTTLAAFLTLAAFSFLYKDNPFYKVAEALVVGVSLGYFSIILWHNTLVPSLFQRLADGNWYYLWLDSSKPWYLIPAILGLMMWSRFFKKYTWISRIPLSLYIGIAAGLAVPREMSNRVVKQLEASMASINWGNFDGVGFLDPGAGYSQLILIFGTICALIYFFFSKEHTGTFGRLAKFGLWIMMLGFGSAFGFTVMARISLLINRIQFLHKSWMTNAFNEQNQHYSFLFPLLFYLVVLLLLAYIVREFVLSRRNRAIQ